MNFTPNHITSTLELIGADDTVAQNNYSKSVEIDLGAIDPISSGGNVTGELLNYRLISTGGDILKPNGKIIFLSADPDVSANDNNLTAAEWKTVIGIVDVAVADWVAESNGTQVGSAAEEHDHSILFSATEKIYAVWLHELVTSFNSAVGDDEVLELNVTFRRDS